MAEISRIAELGWTRWARVKKLAIRENQQPRETVAPPRLSDCAAPWLVSCGRLTPMESTLTAEWSVKMMTVTSSNVNVGGRLVNVLLCLQIRKLAGLSRNGRGELITTTKNVTGLACLLIRTGKPSRSLLIAEESTKIPISPLWRGLTTSCGQTMSSQWQWYGRHFNHESINCYITSILYSSK